eukprot:4807406-Pyramimonas_sp.AAC.1
MQKRQLMKYDLAKAFLDTAYHSVLGSFGNASTPRLTTRVQSLKKILGKGYSWDTTCTLVDD